MEEEEWGDGLSVVKTCWKMKKSQVTELSEDPRVCIGTGIALGSLGPVQAFLEEAARGQEKQNRICGVQGLCRV